MSDVTTPTAEGVALPDEFAAYKAARLGVAPAEQPAPVQEVAAEQPTSEATEQVAETPAPESETGEQDIPEQEPERDDKGRFKPKDDLPPGVHKRIQKEIDRAVAARKAAEAELEAIRAQKAAIQGTDPVKTPAQSVEANTDKFDKPEPKITEFEDIDQYIAAVSQHAREAAKFEARQAIKAELEAQRKGEAAKQAEQQQSAAIERWNSQATEARKQYADFDEVLEDAERIPDGPGQGVIAQAFAESEKGAHLAYWLAKNPEQAKSIARLSPMKAAMELGRVEAALSKPAQPQKPKISAAPEPPRQRVDGPPKGSPNLEDFATYRAVRMKQQAERRAQRF